MSGVGWDGKDVGVAAGNEVEIDEEPIGGPPDIGQESVVRIVFFDVMSEPDDGPRGQKFIGAFTGLVAEALHRFSWVFGFWGVDTEKSDALALVPNAHVDGVSIDGLDDGGLCRIRR